MLRNYLERHDGGVFGEIGVHRAMEHMDVAIVRGGGHQGVTLGDRKKTGGKWEVNRRKIEGK